MSDEKTLTTIEARRIPIKNKKEYWINNFFLIEPCDNFFINMGKKAIAIASLTMNPCCISFWGIPYIPTSWDDPRIEIITRSKPKVNVPRNPRKDNSKAFLMIFLSRDIFEKNGNEILFFKN